MPNNEISQKNIEEIKKNRMENDIFKATNALREVIRSYGIRAVLKDMDHETYTAIAYYVVKG